MNEDEYPTVDGDCWRSVGRGMQAQQCAFRPLRTSHTPFSFSAIAKFGAPVDYAVYATPLEALPSAARGKVPIGKERLPVRHHHRLHPDERASMLAGWFGRSLGCGLC